MKKNFDTMYTLGQLARVIWRDEIIPQAVLDKLLTMPASGLALAIKSAKDCDQDLVSELVDRLPSRLKDPIGGVKAEAQGPFWLGYYHYVTALDAAENCGPTQLSASGAALYGERWQTDLARDLGVDPRRIRQWMSGDRPIPAGVWGDIANLLRERQIAISTLLSG